MKARKLVLVEEYLAKREFMEWQEGADLGGREPVQVLDALSRSFGNGTSLNDIGYWLANNGLAFSTDYDGGPLPADVDAVFLVRATAPRAMEFARVGGRDGDLRDLTCHRPYIDLAA